MVKHKEWEAEDYKALALGFLRVKTSLRSKSVEKFMDHCVKKLTMEFHAESHWFSMSL